MKTRPISQQRRASRISERHQQAARRVDEPSPGHFRIRLVRAGPWVAAEIRRSDEGVWSAWIDGAAMEPANADAALAAEVFRIWHYGEIIAEHEHAYLVERARWARTHAPDAPEANPTRPIRIGSEPPAF